MIEDRITTLRPYNARYTGDHRSFFREGYAEMITRVSLDLFDLARCAASVFVTVRERRRVGFSRPASGVWLPHACCPAPLRRRPDVVAVCCPALTIFVVDDDVMRYFLFGREAHDGRSV